MVGSHHPLYFTVGWYLVIYFTIGFKSVSLSFTVGSPLADHFNMSSLVGRTVMLAFRSCDWTQSASSDHVWTQSAAATRWLNSVSRPRGEWTLIQVGNNLHWKPTDVEISPDLLKKIRFSCFLWDRFVCTMGSRVEPRPPLSSLVWLKAVPSLAALYTNGPFNPTSRYI